MRATPRQSRDGTSRALISIGSVQVLIVLVALARSKVLSTLLGPADFGVVSTIDQTVLTLVTVGALGVPFTALKFMARGHSENPEAFRQTYASFFRALTFLALLTVAVVLLLLGLRPGIFGADMAPYRAPIATATLGVPAAMLTMLGVNALAAAQEPAASALVGLLVAAGPAAGAIVGDVTHGIEGLYVGAVAGGVVTTAAALRFVRRHLGLRVDGAKGDLVSEFRRRPEIISYSLLLYASTAAYAVAMLVTRYSVLSRLGAEQAGLLQAVLSVALTVGAVMRPMNNLFLVPLVNRRIPVHGKFAAADDFAGNMTVLLAVAALPMVLFPKLVVTALFTREFAAAAGVLSLFIVWQCLHQLVDVYLQLLIGLDDVAFAGGVAFAMYVGCAALVPMLLPRAGLGGAAVALAVGVGIGALCALARLRAKFGCRPSGAVVARTACTLGAIVLAGYVFPDRRGEHSATGIAARVAYAFATAGVMWTRLGPAERGLVAATVARVRGDRRRVRPDPSRRAIDA